MRNLAVKAICAVLLGGAAQAADLPARDPGSLAAALEAAAPGDRILLAPGAYGDVTIGPRRGRGAVTIAAAEENRPPVFRSLFLRDADRVSLVNLTITFGSVADPLTSRALEVRRCVDIRLERLSISSSANEIAGDDAYGVIIRGSRNVSLLASRIHDVFRGVAVFDSDNVTVSAADIARVGSDGVVAQGVIGLKVENSSFTNFVPVDPVRWHPDAIQLWSRGAKRANERIVIRGNVIQRGAGAPAQGIFVKTPEIASREILIERNRIEQSMGQGIFVQNAANVTIRENKLIVVAPFDHAPAIEVRAPFENAVVEDNDAQKFRLPSGVTARDNRKSD